jgi:dolichyl-phosphate beta-glucosyltransferase
MSAACPLRRHRVAAALTIGLVSAAYVTVFYRRQSALTVSDFDAIWTAARALRAGSDPYAAVQSPPWPWDLQYPLPAVLIAVPFSVLPLELARGVFMGVSLSLLAYGMSARAWWPLIGLAGGQTFFALQSVQWTPLLAASMLLPVLRFLWCAKPTSATPLFTAQPDWRPIVGGVVLVALSFVIWPGWFDSWLAAARAAPHRPAVLRGGGVLLLLALWRWRLPEGRQLATLAFMPLSPHLYEAVPLLLVARNRREMLALAVCGTVGLAAGAVLPKAWGPDHGPIPWMVVLFSAYLPALAVVLRHRTVNSGGWWEPTPAARPQQSDERRDPKSLGKAVGQLVQQLLPEHLMVQRPRISVVIPAYNEASRLEPTLRSYYTYLRTRNDSFEILVVDDGSIDGTTDLVERVASQLGGIRLIRLAENQGKGFAVRSGVVNARGGLVLFADADGATPAAELERLESAIADGADVAIGSRVLRAGGVRVRARLHRRLIGRLYHILVGLCGVRDIHDTQCGFKLFRGPVAQVLFSRMRTAGFSFDVEVLMMARLCGYRVVEVPVNWTHQLGSRINLVTDSARMAFELLQIRARRASGDYQSPHLAPWLPREPTQTSPLTV